MTRARGTSKHRRNAARNEARRVANLQRKSEGAQQQDAADRLIVKVLSEARQDGESHA